MYTWVLGICVICVICGTCGICGYVGYVGNLNPIAFSVLASANAQLDVHGVSVGQQSSVHSPRLKKVFDDWSARIRRWHTLRSLRLDRSLGRLALLRRLACLVRDHDLWSLTEWPDQGAEAHTRQ